MKLSNTAIQNAVTKDKPYRLFDGAGLYIEVHPNGGKYWRFKYRYHGKEKRLSLGIYPDVGLKKARDKLTHVRQQLSDDIDPARQRKQDQVKSSTEHSFEGVAREWFGKHKHNWADSHSSKMIRRLERDIFPWLGTMEISTIEAPEILSVLRRIEDRGSLDTAHRAKQNCGQVFRYAVATGRAGRDPTTDLKGAIPPTKINHFPTITDPKAIGSLLRHIDSYRGSFVTKQALRIAPLVFVRPGELRRAEWTEFDLDNAEWRIPAEKMKLRRIHLVPLATQVSALLEELKPLTGNGQYLFPGQRSSLNPMSENTLNAALRNLGYSKEEFTGHGFKSMASTLLNEQGWHPDAIERQLAHAERNSVRAAYNYAEYLEERRRMMQAWANYLDELKSE